MSWVETTCPPGCTSHEYASDAWVHGEAHANRRAWERWALEVLGDRVRWRDRWGGLEIAVPGAGKVYRGGTDDDGAQIWIVQYDSGGTLDDRPRDPVEALARLAFLTGAYLGPAEGGRDG